MGFIIKRDEKVSGVQKFLRKPLTNRQNLIVFWYVIEFGFLSKLGFCEAGDDDSIE